MSTGNRDLEGLIRHVGAEGKAPAIDVGEVKDRGLHRRRRRRMALGTLAGLGGLVVVTGIIAVGGDNRVEPAPGTLGPGCAPLGVYLASTASAGADRITSLTVKANSAFKANAVIPDTTHARYTSLTIIVAKPGATVDVGLADELPAASAGRPENQLSKQNVSEPGQGFNVDLQSPGAPGTYPIVGYGQYVTAIDCRGSVPSDTAKQEGGTYAFDMGNLVVTP